MNLEKAEAIACEKINVVKNRIDRVSESANYFIFSVMPIGVSDDTQRSFIPPIGVHKSTGEVVAFNPVRFREEIASIKRIR